MFETTSPLLLIIVGACFLSTTPVLVDSQTDIQSEIKLRSWDQVYAMAKAVVAQLSLREKCNLPSGVGDYALYSTAFAGGIHIAATWDRELFYQRAVSIGQEFRGKGIHYALGPMVNMDLNARDGRNWEGFGSDPYLAGENAFFYIQGVQDQGVVTSTKHYICNEQDTHRSTANVNDDVIYSANLDDKTMHEIYLWPFAASVVAGTGSVMCSANEVNDTRACQNDKAQNGLLKGELGYMGNLLTDWMRPKSTVDSVLAGLIIWARY